MSDDYAAILAEVRETADKLSRAASYDLMDPARQCQAIYQDAQRILALVAPHCPPVIEAFDDAPGDDYLHAATVEWVRAYGGQEPTP